jgi:hypothetical protein
MCSPANDPNVWDILTHLLQDRGPGTDSVVRLTAATALQECVDVRCFTYPRPSCSRSIQTLDFDIDVFVPYLPTAVTELVKLMGETDTMEAKQRLAKSLNVVIQRAGTRVSFPCNAAAHCAHLLLDYTTRTNDFRRHPSVV